MTQQVHENEFISQATKGILVYGKGSADSLAHALRVNDSGEPQIAELPNTMVSASAAANSKPFRFAFGTKVFAVPRAKRAEDGTASANWSTWNVGQFHDFNLGSSSLDSAAVSDVGLLTMGSPKQMSTLLSNEFTVKYFAGDAAVTMTGGSHASGTSLAVNRFRRGAISFLSGVNGTPPGTIKMVVFGRPTTASAHQVPLKRWEWDADSFINGISNNLLLVFDVVTPFIHIGVTATPGGDASNNYEIGTNSFYVNLFS